MAERTIPEAGPNYWAALCIGCGALGFALALTAPIPFIPIISIFNWPLGLAAIIAGWLGRRHPGIAGDRQAASRIRLGIRLGCAGWIVQFVTSVVKVFLLAGLLWALFGSAVHGLPGTTPVP